MNWMDLAFEYAHQALEKDEVPVGAVIVKDKQLIAVDHNQMRLLNNPLAHAESLVLEKALEILKTPYLEECDLYVTLEPCFYCAAALSLTRLRRVYFAAYDTKMGGIDHGPCLFSISPHKPEWYGGIQEKRAQNLLKDFFKSKR